MQPLVHCKAITRLALVCQFQTVVQELETAFCSLAGITLLKCIGIIQKGVQPARLANYQVPEMGSQRRNEVLGVESLGQDFVKDHKRGAVVSRKESVHQAETVLIVQHIEVLYYALVLDVSSAERNGLVEYGQRIAHRSVRLARYHVQGFVLYLNPFLVRNVPQVAHHIHNAYAVEVIDLASGQDGWDDLVLFSGCQNEYSVGRRLLQGFQECIESLVAEHMHLIYDIDAVAPHLGRNLHFLNEVPHSVNAAVGRGVQLIYAI